MTLLRDRRKDFDEAGVLLYGISRDSPWSHAAWAEVLDLDFSLLSDWNGDAVRTFDIAFENDGLRDTAERSAFLVDRDGIIRRTWRYEVFELPNVDELLEAARSL
jgi:peroxiredoxin